MKKIVLILHSLVFPLLFVAASFGQSTFERYAERLPGFQLTLETRTDDASQAPHQLLSETLLEEAGFRQFSAWEVRTGDRAVLSSRVFETESSVGTYELFNSSVHAAQTKDWHTLDLPVGNVFSPQGGVFWRGNFLFHVLPAAGTLSESAFSDFVKAVATTVDLENLLPVSVSHLPEKDLVAGSIRFYLGAGSLSENPAFPPPLLKEIGLSDRIEIAEARYTPDDRPLFVIGYPTPALADKYLVRMQDQLQSYFSDEGIYMKRSGVLIGLFIGPEAQAREVLGGLQYKPTIKWFQKKEPPRDDYGVMAFAGAVTKAILGTGSLLLMIIGGGLVAGMIRYGLFKIFPRLLHRKDMVRLNLP